MSFALQPLKRPPRHVVLLHWPRDGEAWIHPDDRHLAGVLLPSDRVFLCEDDEGPYHVLTYGHRTLRVEPVMCVDVPDEGLRVGDQVEVLSRMGKNWPQIGFIREVRWSETQQAVWYQIRTRDRLLPTRYRADDLRRVERFDRSAPI
jgi:hypothetical protein